MADHIGNRSVARSGLRRGTTYELNEIRNCYLSERWEGAEDEN